jgi:S-adenosylmethionine:tRNA ribosyltransferase-isomerase
VVQRLDQARPSRLAPPAGDCRSLEFDLPPELEASEPPEGRGLARDEVRLMVSHYRDDRVVHTRFRHIGDHLHPGDVLVINTSGTLNAALPADRADGTRLELHLSTRLPADLWVVELRQSPTGGRQSPAGGHQSLEGGKGFMGGASLPFFDAQAGERLDLPGGGRVTLLTPYRSDQRAPFLVGAEENGPGRRIRLWVATLHLPSTLEDYLARYGFPIRYGYVPQPWPGAYYQTVYAEEVGSAEMPSAGRAFTHELLARLVARGVQVAPLVLHTGVASPEDHEPPYEEFYRVSLDTARVVNAARAAGRPVVAVGTTTARALETVADETGAVHPGRGWTDLVITPGRGLRAVDGLLTGLHEPRASHLALLETLAGPCHLNVAYAQAIERGYLWHEFGDLHLILP